MYSKIERLFKEKHVADKADLVKFKGSMTLWPVQKTNTAQQEPREQYATNTKLDLF